MQREDLLFLLVPVLILTVSCTDCEGIVSGSESDEVTSSDGAASPFPVLSETVTKSPTGTSMPVEPRVSLSTKAEEITALPTVFPVMTLAPNKTATLRRTKVASETPEPSIVPVVTVTASVPESTKVREAAFGEERKVIIVDVSEQKLYAREGDSVVLETPVSTGLPRTPTVLGEYQIYVKFRYDDMSGPDYYLPDVPCTMYFYRGYGIHGTYWHSNFGHRMSHGCVNLPTEKACELFEWADVGTPVVVQE